MISVVIPTCRRPDLLARCLDRLAPGTQTLSAERYEVIVTDDGTETVATFLAEKYPWASWGAGPRRGPAANRNAGARRARGDWIAFTDDDCVPDQNWLAAFAATIHNACRVYEGKTTCAAGIRSPLEHAPVNMIGGCLWSCNIFICRATFNELGGFDERYLYPYMEDADLRDRLVKAGHAFEFVPTAVVDHPPRRWAPGRQLARYHESWVYHWYKSGRRALASPRLLHLIARTRLAAICGHRFNADTLQAVGSLAVELGGMSLRMPHWERKYRRQFLAAVPR